MGMNKKRQQKSSWNSGKHKTKWRLFSISIMRRKDVHGCCAMLNSLVLSCWFYNFCSRIFFVRCDFIADREAKLMLLWHSHIHKVRIWLHKTRQFISYFFRRRENFTSFTRNENCLGRLKACLLQFKNVSCVTVRTKKVCVQQQTIVLNWKECYFSLTSPATHPDRMRRKKETKKNKRIYFTLWKCELTCICNILIFSFSLFVSLQFRCRCIQSHVTRLMSRRFKPFALFLLSTFFELFPMRKFSNKAKKKMKKRIEQTDVEYKQIK